jgi:hypothetical protein
VGGSVFLCDWELSSHRRLGQGFGRFTSHNPGLSPEQVQPEAAGALLVLVPTPIPVPSRFLKSPNEDEDERAQLHVPLLLSEDIKEVRIYTIACRRPMFFLLLLPFKKKVFAGKKWILCRNVHTDARRPTRYYQRTHCYQMEFFGEMRNHITHRNLLLNFFVLEYISTRIRIIHAPVLYCAIARSAVFLRHWAKMSVFVSSSVVEQKFLTL